MPKPASPLILALAAFVLAAGPVRRAEALPCDNIVIANPDAAKAGDGFGHAIAPFGSKLVVGSIYDDAGAADTGGVRVVDIKTGALVLSINNPTPAAGDEFGYSVAAVGGNILAGARKDGAGAPGAGAAHVFNGTTGALIRTIPNPEPAVFDYFGASVAALGSNAVVGAYQNDAGASNAGSVYIFNPSTGALVRTIDNPTPAPNEYFGWAIAALGSNLLVGAYQDETGAAGSGAVYLFNGSTGELMLTIPNPTPAANDNFGWAVAAVGPNILAGALGRNDGATDSGIAYLFDGATGSLLHTLHNPSPVNYDYFGASVAGVDGNALIGAILSDAGGPDGGAAFLFSGSTGELLRILTAPAPAANDYFGFSVAAAGIDIAAGAPFADAGGADSGAIHVFPGACELKSPNEEDSGNFGLSLAGAQDFSGDGLGDIVAGAYLEDPGASPSNAGRVYLYNGATGNLRTTIASPAEDADGNFGRNVQGIADLNADGKNDIIAGGWQENPPGTPADSGTVHVFSGRDGTLLRTLLSPNAEFGGRFGARASGMGDLDGDGKQEVLVGAPYEDPGEVANDSGMAYIFSGATGALLRSFQSPGRQSGGLFGFFAAGFSDLNGDLKGDLAIGAHMEEASGLPADSGRVHVFNGNTGALFFTLVSPGPKDGGQFGRNLARLFDVTEDTRPDLIVSAPFEEAPGKPADSGRAYSFAGSNGAYLRTFVSPNPTLNGRFGWCVQSIPDVDGDGDGEVLAGAPYESPGGVVNAGRAYLFSGGTGVLLKTLVSPNPQAGGLFGVFIHGVQDNNGDGLWEIAVGARLENPGGSPNGAGRIYQFKSPAY